MLAITINDNFLEDGNQYLAKYPRCFQIGSTYIRVFAQLCFNETQKMLLIHTSRVMYVSIDFTNVIKVSVRHPLTKYIVNQCQMWTMFPW